MKIQTVTLGVVALAVAAGAGVAYGQWQSQEPTEPAMVVQVGHSDRVACAATEDSWPVDCVTGQPLEYRNGGLYARTAGQGTPIPKAPRK